MGWEEAAGWGLAGGATAVLINAMATVRALGFRWPWGDDPDGFWPHMFVYSGGLALGGVVAAAAHAQISGPWPAFIMGVGAPAVLRAALSHIEVEEIKPESLTKSSGGNEG